MEQDVLKETEEILKQKTHWMFPNDYPSVSQSVNSGKPVIDVAARTAIAKSYKDFAQSFAASDQPSSVKGGIASWLNPFKSRSPQSSSAEA